MNTAPERLPCRYQPPRWLAPARTFAAMMKRDLVVAGRNWPTLLAQATVLPCGILLVFGRLLVELGYAREDYAAILLPGVVATNAFLGAFRGTAVPLALAFHATGELEDRLLAPVSGTVVAAEKVVFGALHGVADALVLAPIGLVLLPGIHWPGGGYAAAAGILVLGGLVGGALGLCFATLVPARRMALVLTIALPALMFTGAAHIPFRLLKRARWFQILCAGNPLTYVSEGTRSALFGAELPAIGSAIDVAVLATVLVVAGLAGLAGFRGRTLNPKLIGPPPARRR